MAAADALTGNSFLDALPASTRAALSPSLTRRVVRPGEVLARPGEPFAEVVFPIHSVASTVTVTEEGSAVEVGLAGHEGLSPVAIVFGSDASRHATTVQIPDSALTISVKSFLTMYASDQTFRSRCASYAEYLFTAATQFAACNAVHPAEERYARWLLMADDRVGAREFSLTQEFSAQMLGVRRATVTGIAAVLAERGVISYRRGRIVVLDREGLEDSTCECYAAVNGELERLMGYGARRPTSAASRDGESG